MSVQEVDDVDRAAGVFHQELVVALAVIVAGRHDVQTDGQVVVTA